MTEISRRKFIQLTVVGGAAAAAGCKNEAIYKSEVTGQYGGYDNRVYPYLNQPDGVQDGVPQYFATACQMCPAGCGLLVRTIGGRAHKVEGNPAHPVSGGRTCARGQASLQHLYNPDRLRFPVFHATRGATRTVKRGPDAQPEDRRTDLTEVAATRIDWETALARTVSGFQNAKGRVAILFDAQTQARSPSLMRLVSEFAQSFGSLPVGYCLLDASPWGEAVQAVYGHQQPPTYQLDQADFIVSFGGDFLEAWPSPVYYSRLFGEFRQGPRRRQGEHGRFVYVGPRMSMTAAKADQWLPCNPGTESAVALGVLTALGGPGMPIAQAASLSGLAEQQINGLAQGFQKAGARSVAVGGNGLMASTNPAAAFTAVESLNAQIKSQCVGFGTAALDALPEVPPARNPGKPGGAIIGRSLSKDGRTLALEMISGPSTFTATLSNPQMMQMLLRQMQAGQIGALLILGQPNPVFTLPTATGFTEALAKVPFVAALTPFEDETSAYADVVLPTRTFLEDWGDDIPAVLPPYTRMATLRQPVIDPQFVGGQGQATDHLAPFTPWMDTRPLGDLLIDLAKRMGKPLRDADMRAVVRRTWAGLGRADLAAATTDNDQKWVAALAQGGIWEIAPIPASKVTRPKSGSVPAIQTYMGPQNSPAPGTFALHLYPHIYWTDGQHSNLGWLQETPDPMTSAVWNSWVEINSEVAQRMDIRTGDVVRISTAHGQIEVPAVPYPAIHPNVIAMPIGQGHTVYGRNAAARGANPLRILDPGEGALGSASVQLSKVRSADPGYQPDQNTLVLTQDRPGGQEPAAVKDLIHTTAREWKTAEPVSGAPQAEGSIFNRQSGKIKPGSQ